MTHKGWCVVKPQHNQSIKSLLLAYCILPYLNRQAWANNVDHRQRMFVVLL